MKKITKKKLKKEKTGPKKTVTRRQRKRFPALNPSYNLKSRTDEISDIQEYAKNIPDDMIDPKTGVNVKEYLNSFVEEYVNANFKHRGPKIMKKVAEKRERYRRNNHRNDDIYTREKAQGALRYTEDIKNTADTIDETIDLESAIDNNGDFYFWKEFDTED